MLINKLNKKAQNVSECALLIGLVAAGLVAMTTTFRRSIQAIVKVMEKM